MKRKSDKPERKAGRIGEGNAEGGRGKKAAANVAVFFKKNIYLILMILCVLAIIAMIIVAAVYNSSNKGPDPDIGVINPDDPTPSLPDDPVIDKPDKPNSPDPVWTFAPQLPIDAAVSKSYVEDTLVFNPTLNKYMVHLGTDFAAEVGTRVNAVFDGVVKSIDTDSYYGTVVTIDHSNGYVTTTRLLDNVSVKVGDTVKTGDKIGEVGSGYFEVKDGAHTHIELSVNSQDADLMKYIIQGDK